MKRLFLLKLVGCLFPLAGLVLLTLWPIDAVFESVPDCFQAVQQPHPAAVATAPDLQLLFQQTMAGGSAGEQQLDEEQAIIAEQVEQARVCLSDADPAERLVGAEQLSAYPTPQAEGYLLDALKNDDDAAVRAAAANSLGSFKEPGNRVFDGLLLALQDGDEAVSFNAWSSLGILLNRPSLAERTSNNVQVKLRRLLKKAHLTMDMRDSVQEYLQEQQSIHGQ